MQNGAAEDVQHYGEAMAAADSGETAEPRGASQKRRPRRRRRRERSEGVS
jgi:hypothetical protein